MLLFVAVCCCLLLFVAVRCCSLLFVAVRCCSLLFVFVVFFDTRREACTRSRQGDQLAWQYTSCTLHGALLHSTVGASLLDAGCQLALTWREMLAVFPVHLRNGVGSRRSRGSAQSTFGGPFLVLRVPPCGWQESLRSLLLSLVHDILRFTPDDHPDLHRKGDVVIGEASSIASCGSLCLDRMASSRIA